MKIYLISNNLLINNISYDNYADLDIIRKTRVLNLDGEENAKLIASKKELEETKKIYASFYSNAIGTAKYLANKLNIDINLNENFDDCKVGYLGSKNMAMVKGLQDHDFNYKLDGGECLNEVGERIDNEINNIIKENQNTTIFTHKRCILGFLLKHCHVGYNLDENLILEFNNKQVYDDIDTSYDIYEIIIIKNEIKEINYINLEM